MTIKWFGEPWNNTLCVSTPRISIPVGEHCIHCEQAIRETDSGIRYANANGPVAHLDCLLSSIGIRGLHKR